jgi:hypothetical protein
MAGDQPDLVAEPRAEAAGVGPGDRRAIDAVARQEIAGAGPHTKEGCTLNFTAARRPAKQYVGILPETHCHPSAIVCSLYCNKRRVRLL